MSGEDGAVELLICLLIMYSHYWDKEQSAGSISHWELPVMLVHIYQHELQL